MHPPPAVPPTNEGSWKLLLLENQFKFAPVHQIQISVHTSVPFGFKCTILHCDLRAICPARCRRRLRHPSRFFPLLLRLRGHVSPSFSLPHSCSFPHFSPFPRLLPILTRGKGRREGRSFPSLALTVPKARYSPSSPPFPSHLP